MLGSVDLKGNPYLIGFRKYRGRGILIAVL
jgi:hypothetical protein